MKRAILISWILILPVMVVAGDGPTKPLNPINEKMPPPLELVKKKLKRNKNKKKKKVLPPLESTQQPDDETDTNQSSGGTGDTESTKPMDTAANTIERPKPEELPDQPTDGPLTQLHTFRPTSPTDAFTFHAQLLEQRILRLQQAPFLPDVKKTELIAKFTEEQDWLETKQAELQSAGSEAAAQSIRQEIIEHIRTARQEHQRDLARQVPLPERSPVDTASQMTAAFQKIADRLSAQNVDVSALTGAIGQYTAAVDALAQAQTMVEQDQTMENLRAVRDAITAVRDAAQAVRNQIVSLVPEQ